MRTTLLGPLLAIALLFPACKKEPGEGGKAEIRGIVMRQDLNGAGQPVGAPYPFQEARVYIAYGDHDFSDDDVRTGPDGLYVFSWLRKGDYRIYTFGECDCPGGSVAVQHTVSIGDKKDVVTVPVITVDNW